MASTYSTNLKIELMGTGEQSGLWGSKTNTNLGTTVEEAIVGQGTANFSSDADLTLTLTNSNASQVARALVLNVTGTISATRNLVVPTINKPYVVRNNTTGGQSVVVKTSAGSGITVPNGKTAWLYTDGTNVVEALDTVTNLNYTGTLTGGTGVINIGSGQLVKDAAGNLGLSVTPSAWGGGFKAVQQLGGALWGNTSHQAVIQNAYYNGSTFIYYNNGYATNYQQGNGNGSHVWSVAPSGTVGNPITFTQAMTLDSSSNLGIGTPSPAAKLDVQGGGTITTLADWNTTSTAMFRLANPAVRIGFGYDAADLPLIQGFDSGNASRDICIQKHGGKLLVGTTSGSAKVHIADSANQPAIQALNSNASFTSVLVNIESARTTTDGSYNFIGCAHSGVAYRFYVRDSGNVVNTNNSYGAISDLKLKENIVDVSPKLAKLLQVRIVNYTLKSDPDKAKLIGVIAQELEQISPGLIEETPDYGEVKKTREVEAPAVDAVLDADGNEVAPAVPASTKTEEYTERVPTGTVTKSVKYSVFVPMLIKGLQEQHAIVETLQTQLDAQNTAMQLLADRLAALEAK
jgi:hypothetical protein